MSDTNDIFTARLVAGAIGADRFNDLIISLPREFFELDADGKAQAWRGRAESGQWWRVQRGGAGRHCTTFPLILIIYKF